MEMATGDILSAVSAKQMEVTSSTPLNHNPLQIKGIIFSIFVSRLLIYQTYLTYFRLIFLAQSMLFACMSNYIFFF